MALHNRRDGNREAIEAFANKFNPPLNVARTERVSGNAVTNGWTAAYHDPEVDMGLTAVVWGGGYMRVWFEVTGTAHEAAYLGAWLAEVVQSAREPGFEDPVTEGTPEARDFSMVDALPKVDEDNRQREAAGLISDRMEVKPGSEVSVALPDLTYEHFRVRPGFDHAGEPIGNYPNPAKVDMTGLNRVLNHKLITMFPELAYGVDSSGNRFRISGDGQVRDDGAGFCTAQQLAAAGSQVILDAPKPIPNREPRRSLPRMPAAQGGAQSMDLSHVPQTPGYSEPAIRPKMGAPLRPGCDHDMERNSIGGGYTCRKCHGFEPSRSRREDQKIDNARSRAESQLGELAKREAWQARDDQARIERQAAAKLECEGSRGGHVPVTIDEDGRAVAVCQFCGTELPAEGAAASGAPEGSESVVG